MITVQKYSSINEIDKNTWNSFNKSKTYFKSYEFIKCVEDSNIENSKYWYLIFSKNEEIIGAAVLSSFKVSLDLLLDETSKKIVQFIRKLFPSFLDISFLFCGLPISIGKDALLISKSEFKREMILTLANEMKLIAKENKDILVSLKEFFTDQNYGLEVLLEEGFVQSLSIPYFEMNVPWNSFDSYLQNLRYNYRRQILQSISKVDFSAVDYNQQKLDKDHATVIIGKENFVKPEIFYRQYIEVMNRATVVLEILNLDFFINLFANNEVLDIISIKKNDILGSAVLIKEKDCLVFLLVGLDYTMRDKYHVYFNLIYSIIMYAIKNGYKKIGLGQTSEYIKQRVGGYPKSMIFYNYSNSRFVRFLLKNFNKALFPETKLKLLNVFHKTTETK